MSISKKSLFVFVLITATLLFTLSFQPLAYAKEKVIVLGRPLVERSDPATVKSSEDVANVLPAYDCLTTLDRNGNVIPELAEFWEISPDFKHFTFHLRKRVKFHDGTPFNAQAVKFSLDRMLKVGQATIGLYIDYADENSCEVVDDYTIKIHLTKPLPQFPMDAATANYGIVSPTYVKKHATSDDPEAVKWMAKHGCGAGPFKIAEFIPGQRLVFEKFEDYWGGSPGGKTPAKVEKVIFEIIEDPSTARLMLEKGDIDIAVKLNIEQYEKLKAKPGIKVLSYLVPVVAYITYDVSKPPFSDMKLREAISHAINYEEIVEYILKGNAKVKSGLIPEGLLGYNPNLGYSFDLDKARELIKASGYPNGFTTNLIFAGERRPEFEQVALYIQAYLKKIGIDVKIQKLAFDAQLSKMERGNYGMSLMCWTTTSPDPDAIVGWLYDSELKAGAGWVGSYWFDRDALDKIHRTRDIADSEERKVLYQAVDQKAVDQAIYVYLYQLTEQFAMRDNIKNFHFDTFMKYYLWATEKE